MVGEIPNSDLSVLVIAPGPHGSAGIQRQRVKVTEGDGFDAVNRKRRSKERAIDRCVVADLSICVVATTEYGVRLSQSGRAESGEQQDQHSHKQARTTFYCNPK